MKFNHVKLEDVSTIPSLHPDAVKKTYDQLNGDILLENQLDFVEIVVNEPGKILKVKPGTVITVLLTPGTYGNAIGYARDSTDEQTLAPNSIHFVNLDASECSKIG